MDKNTVIIPIEEYNKLRDFRNKILEGKIYTRINLPGIADFRFWTIEECLDNLEKARQAELDEIKNMSYWEFKRWKKNK